MKLCAVPYNQTHIKIPRAPEYNILDSPNLTADPVEIRVDVLQLEWRDLNGIERMVAYDRITDTLYIKEPDREELC